MSFSKNIAGPLFGIIGIIILLVWLTLRWGFWLPDVITHRTVILDELTTANGDGLRLIQRWVGDGYLTRLQHTNQQGRAWWFTIEGDAMKAWSGSIQMTDDKTVRIDVLRDRYSYDVQSHVGADGMGKPRWILELPEDGRPAFVLGEVPSRPNPDPYDVMNRRTGSK